MDVSSYDELKEAISQGKWARGPWSARYFMINYLSDGHTYQSEFCVSYFLDCSDKDETVVKEETGATIRCFPFDQPKGSKTCLMTGNPADEVAIFAKSY